MTDLTALYRQDADEDEVVAAYQHLIDTGDAWRLEGHVGRTAAGFIEAGLCILGEEGHRDYWGNYVPGRSEVKPGTKGSIEYARERQPDRWPDPCEEEGHDYQPEDIADGVVGGGAAHVWRIYCTRCGAEGEPEDIG